MTSPDEPSILQEQPCPVCGKNTLTLTEAERDIPFFGRAYLFSMDCSDCNYHKADVELSEQKEPCKIQFEVSQEQDLQVRVVKSSEATVKIPHIMTITPGPSSNGYVTNIEGILNRVRRMIETARDTEEDDAIRKKAKSHLKHINRALMGQEPLKITLEDPTGNSAIISDKAKVSALKGAGSPSG